MLLRNGEIKRLSALEINNLKKEYTLPLRVIYPKSRVKPSISKHNKLPDQPNSISFPFKAIVKGEKGSEEWIYCDSYRNDKKGNLVTMPATFFFKGKYTITEKDIELLFWLVNCCPGLVGGKNFNGNAKCVIEDLKAEAKTKVNNKRNKSRFETLLYDEELGLGIEKIKEIAKAYFIDNVEDMTDEQIIIAVETAVLRDKKNGIEKFIELSGADEVIKIRSLLQQAKDKEIIMFNLKKVEWQFITEPGVKNILICTVRKGTNENDALLDYYRGNVKFATELMSAINGDKYVKPLED